MTDDSKSQRELSSLVIGHFDSSLTAAQEQELADALTTSAEAKQLFLSHMRMEGRLHSLGRDGFLREPAAESLAVSRLPDDTSPVAHREKAHALSMRSRFLTACMSLAVCAAALLLVTSGLFPSRVNASSVLQQAKQAAAGMVDRAYQVTISSNNAQQEAASQELLITTRGRRHYVIQPLDGSYTLGNDGTDYWLTQSDGPVWITHDYRQLAPAMQRRIPNRGMLKLADSRDELLMMPMASLLARIQNSYDAELVESSDPAEHHVRATLRSPRSNQAQSIDLWANADTGVVLRAQLKWDTGRLTRFALVDAPTLTEQWYHYSQHAPDREVRRVETTR